MKRFIAGFMTCVLLMCGTSVFAETKKTIVAYFGSIKLVVDGKPVAKETLLYEGTTYVPLRAAGEIFGKEVSYNANTKTAYIGAVPGQGQTTPPVQPAATQKADIINVSPRNAEAPANSQVSIKVTGTKESTQAKITDASGNTVATGKEYTLSSIGNKDFILKFTPTSPGKFRGYVSDDAGNSTGRSIEFEVTLATTAEVRSVSTGSSAVAIGENVSLTVYATKDTSRVRLISDNASGDVVESSSYSSSGNEREFKFNWNIKSSYYQGLTTATAKVYAVDDKGNQGGFRSVSVRIDSNAVTISDAYADSTSINANGSTKITVETGTNIEEVRFSVSSGSGSLDRTRMTSYTRSSNGKYIWENTFTAGSSSGTSKITVTASSSSGSSKEATISITVSGGSSGGDNSIIDVTPKSFTAYSDGNIYVTTGKGVNYITYSYGSLSNVRVDNSSVKSDSIEWRFTIRPETTGTSYLQISTYNSSGSHAESKQYPIYAQ